MSTKALRNLDLAMAVLVVVLAVALMIWQGLV